jgi:hypothetical protein
LREEYYKSPELAKTNPERMAVLVTNTLACLGKAFITAVSQFTV